MPLDRLLVMVGEKYPRAGVVDFVRGLRYTGTSVAKKAFDDRTRGVRMGGV